MSSTLRRNLAILVAIEVVLAVFAWRDISRRDSSEVRGPRLLWKLSFFANPGNSMIYWVFGRKKDLSSAL